MTYYSSNMKPLLFISCCMAVSESLCEWYVNVSTCIFLLDLQRRLATPLDLLFDTVLFHLGILLLRDRLEKYLVYLENLNQYTGCLTHLNCSHAKMTWSSDVQYILYCILNSWIEITCMQNVKQYNHEKQF